MTKRRKYEALHEFTGAAFGTAGCSPIGNLIFPEPKRRKDGRGRPWASNRSCLEGILWVLRTGARWRDMPPEYPDGSTCWRRLRMWEEQGIWLAAWRKLLAMLDQRRLLDWGESFLEATFVTAKKGARQLARAVAGKVRSAWWWSTAGAYLSECNLRPRRLPRVPARGKHAPTSKRAATWTRTPTISPAASDCRSWLRLRSSANAPETAGHGVDRPLSEKQPQPPLRGQTKAAPLPQTLENRAH